MNMKSGLLTCWVLACALTPALQAQEAVPSYEPAVFPDDQSELIGKIDFPDADAAWPVRVFCDAGVTSRGSIGRDYCWSPNADGEVFVNAVLRASRMQITPARVNGTPTDIWFQYTVQFDKPDGQEAIRFFPHQFVGVEGSGEGHTSAQRYLPYRAPAGALSTCRGRFTVWFGMKIPAAGGKPLDVRPLNDSINSNCLRHLQNSLEQERYPGLPARGTCRDRLSGTLAGQV